MDDRFASLPRPATLLRIALALFVVAWIFGPYSLRAAVPLWLPFLIALVLELQFLLGALRPAPLRRPDRGPLPIDRERYGYPEPTDELPPAPEDGEADDEEEDEDEGEQEQAEEDAWVWEEAEEAALEPDEEPGGRPARRFAAGVGVIGALALLAWIVDSRTGWNGVDASARAEAAARFSDEASRIAGKAVTIACDEAGEHVGIVQHADGAAIVGGDVAYLTPARCLDLYRLAFEDEARGSQTGRAIAVLAHEAWHLRGIRDEGTTECYALQSGVTLGRRLGLSENTARQMMRRELAENARRGPDSFEYRVPPECRDGGQLDLDAEDTRFP